MHTTTLQVRFNELDPYGHVNHAVYLNYFEMGRIAALDSVGYNLDRMRRDRIHVPVIELSVSFRRPAMHGDELTVVSGISELRAASARWQQQLLRGEDVIATAEVRGAITDETGRPCRGPEGWAAALESLLC